MTKIIGLTGGIGSGKTTIANYFRLLGIPVYNADDEGRKISEYPEVIEAIKVFFGDAIFEDNKLNRAKLAEIVFKDAGKLIQLNAIIHPLVKEDFDKWVLQHSSFSFLIKEAAILFESGSYRDCEFIISAIAPLEIRIKRVIQRDKVSKENVQKRINSQWSDEKRVFNSRYVIENISFMKAKEQIDEFLKKVIVV